MSNQSSYIFNSDYGFNKNEVFYAWLSQEAKAKRDAIRAELKKLPFVESVGFAQNAIGTSDGYMSWGRGDNEHQMTLQVLPCDYEYLRTMQLKITEGRDFREADMKTGAYVLNGGCHETIQMAGGRRLHRSSERVGTNEQLSHCWHLQQLQTQVYALRQQQCGCGVHHLRSRYGTVGRSLQSGVRTSGEGSRIR